MKGSIIGSLSGASGKTVEEGKLATSIKLAFAESKGKQKYNKFVEGEPGEEQLNRPSAVVRSKNRVSPSQRR